MNKFLSSLERIRKTEHCPLCLERTIGMYWNTEERYLQFRHSLAKRCLVKEFTYELLSELAAAAERAYEKSQTYLAEDRKRQAWRTKIDAFITDLRKLGWCPVCDRKFVSVYMGQEGRVIVRHSASSPPEKCSLLIECEARIETNLTLARNLAKDGVAIEFVEQLNAIGYCPKCSAKLKRTYSHGAQAALIHESDVIHNCYVDLRNQEHYASWLGTAKEAKDAVSRKDPIIGFAFLTGATAAVINALAATGQDGARKEIEKIIHNALTLRERGEI